ncbi:protein TANC2, partial [Vespula squamosa]
MMVLENEDEPRKKNTRIGIDSDGTSGFGTRKSRIVRREIEIEKISVFGVTTNTPKVVFEICTFNCTSSTRRKESKKENLTMRSRDSVVYTPVSIGPDTDDEETLVNAEVYSN